MHHYYLYKLTSPSGKVYIGQSRSLRKRFTNYRLCLCDQQPRLCNSLKKHGWDAHTKEIIAEGMMTQHEIDTLEIAHIKRYSDLDISLNIALGGRNAPHYVGRDHPGSRPILQFDTDGTLIREWDNASMAATDLGFTDASNIRIAAKGDDTCFAYGYLWVYRDDHERGVKPIHDPYRTTRKPIVQLTKNGEFLAHHLSARAAAETTRLSQGNISMCLTRKRVSTGGYLWCYREDYDKGVLPAYRKQVIHRKPVIMYDKHGTVLREFDSVEAAAAAGYDRSHIVRHCQGRVKNPRDHYFRYKTI